jgi:hypothetical protein
MAQVSSSSENMCITAQSMPEFREREHLPRLPKVEGLPRCDRLAQSTNLVPIKP